MKNPPILILPFAIMFLLLMFMKWIILHLTYPVIFVLLFVYFLCTGKQYFDEYRDSVFPDNK